MLPSIQGRRSNTSLRRVSARLLTAALLGAYDEKPATPQTAAAELTRTTCPCPFLTMPGRNALSMRSVPK